MQLFSLSQKTIAGNIVNLKNKSIDKGFVVINISLFGFSQQKKN